MRLVTAWFGVFITDDDGHVLEKALFPQDPAEIALRLDAMDRSEILGEEEELAAGRPLAVRENRLAILGNVMNFAQPDLRPEDFGVSRNLLSQAMHIRNRDKLKSRASPDEHIVQAIRTIDDLGKSVNLMTERLHEWHELNFPELSKLVPDPRYIQLIATFGDRDSIIDSGKLDFGDSVGVPVSEADARAMKALACAILAMEKEKKDKEAYIEVRMKEIAPNTSHIAGPLIGARLISLTGGLDRLSKVPSSTIQLLGAEKALFKHIKENARPPKHGVIFGHPIIHRAPVWQRGKIARAFAGKISIAVKMDRYGHEFIGPKLEADLNRRVEDIRKRYPKPKQNPKTKGGFKGGHRKNRSR